MSYFEETQIKGADSPSIDAFGRWRTSEPETIFDSKNIFDDPDLASNTENLPLFFDNQQTSGSGTGTNYLPNESSQTIFVSSLTAGTRVRQTKMRFNYQPGKSQLIFRTFNMDNVPAGITKRIGVFDDDNGLFLQADDQIVGFVRRTNATGTPVDNVVTKPNWNIDPMDGTGPSGVDLDWTDTQILVIDYEWLGVGRARMGFVIDGMIMYAHEFLNANNLGVPYMSTPNLPLRSEISNDGTGGVASFTDICSSVISEGGSEDLGIIRTASTNGTHVDANTENTIYAVMGIRLKSAYAGATVNILNAALQVHTASHKLEWFFLLNPTVAGTFTYADESRSAVQIARGSGSTNTVTGGFQVKGGGYVETGSAASGAAGSTSAGIQNALRLGSLIDGTQDEIVLCVRPIGGSTNVDVEGRITWREGV